MKVIEEYEKIGDYLEMDDNSVLGKYCFCGEHIENGCLMFKDEKNFTKHWDKPCYVPSSGFKNDNIYAFTDCYETYKTLLEKCLYNETMCRCAFERLCGQSVETWFDEIDAEDCAYFYDFVKVGSTVFWNVQPWKNVPLQYGKVKKIKDKPSHWTLDTKIFIEVRDFLGEEIVVKSRLRELSKTDIQIQMRKWEK